MKYRSAVPVIATADIPATLAFYTDVLGFAQHFVFGNPPVYAGVQRDGVLIYISQDEKMAALVQSGGLHPEVFLWVADVDRVYAEHIRRGAKIVEEVADRPWDARQYVVEDPNGYHLKVAEPIEA